MGLWRMLRLLGTVNRSRLWHCAGRMGLWCCGGGDSGRCGRLKELERAVCVGEPELEWLVFVQSDGLIEERRLCHYVDAVISGFEGDFGTIE